MDFDAAWHRVSAAGYAVPTEVQRRVFVAIAEGSDVVARSPAGTGKTAAFTVPLIERILAGKLRRVVVIEPSRELVIQAANESRRLIGTEAVRVVAAYGGTPPQRQEELIASGAQIIIGTHGRLTELLQSGVLKPSGVDCLVLDEADRLLNDQFIDGVRHFASRLPRERQTLMFGVTLPSEVAGVALEFVKRDFVDVTAGRDGGGVAHKLLVAEDKVKALAKQIKEHPVKSLVFCTDTTRLEEIVAGLKYHGLRAIVLHSGRESQQRNSSVKRFAEGSENILVATDLASRGLHFPDVARVYSVELPKSPQDYIHRAGRTGRMRKSGECISICTSEEVRELHKLTGVKLETIV